ncbi:hypothetical protein [Halpernia sp. GG3]
MKKISFSLFIILMSFATIFGQQFKVSYPKSLLAEPFTGNVIVFMSKENKEPRDGAIGLESFPCFSVFVNNIQHGQEIVIDYKAVSYPTTLSNIERGDYFVQIVWDRNLGGRSISSSLGNLYNPTEKITITKDYNKFFTISTTQIVPPVAAFKES